jgi:hypothetical protein
VHEGRGDEYEDPACVEEGGPALLVDAADFDDVGFGLAVDGEGSAFFLRVH